jgi:Na+/H+ antiporter NhaD/arsenite permease-like protein
MLALVLVGLVFFTSMLVTNDVALLTFVPFSLMTLRLADQTALAGPVIVLETLAANLGSALTPVGNPQNLYLYTRFDLSPAAFFDAVLPLALPSAALLFAGVMLLGSHPVRPAVRMSETTPARPRLAVFAAVFLIALLTVFDLLPAWGALAAGMAPLLLFARTEVRRVDYTLLLTFVFFFLFIGNLVRIEEIHNFMRPLLAGPREVLLSGAGLSQVLSNVPAAILLSGFTGDARSLLRGVNIGGCGTIVASLASLISYKLFIREHPASGMRYLALHTLVNLPFLLLLTGVALLLAR